MANTTTWVLQLLDKITGPLKNSTSAVKVLDNKANSLEKTLTKISIGGAALGVLSMDSIAFSGSMAKANTMANLGAKEFEKLKDQVSEIGDIAPKVRDSLGKGLYQTISNGVPKDNWVQFLADSSKAAVGGLAGIDNVVGVTSTIIKNYAMEWSNAGNVQDKIQNTAKLGKTSFEELGAALPKVTGNASNLGVGLDELLGTFASLTGVTGNTAEVSTQMSAIFTSLIKPSSEARKMADKMGISFNSLSIKQAGGLQNFVKIIDAKVKTFTEKSKMSSVDVYGKLFGSAEALRAVIPLTTTIAADFEQKTKQVSKSAGAIQTAFDIMSATTTAKAQIMRNRFGSMMDGIVDVLAPVSVSFMNIMGSVFSFTKSIMDNNKPLTKFVIVSLAGGVALYTVVTVIALVNIKLTLFAARVKVAYLATLNLRTNLVKAMITTKQFALSLLASGINAIKVAGQYAIMALSGIGSLIAPLITATLAQYGLNTAMLANPVGLVVLGILAVGAAVYGLIKYWDAVKNFLIGFGKFMLKNNPFAWLFKVLDFFPDLKANFDVALNFIFDKVMAVWNKIKKIVSAVGNFLGFSVDDVEVIDSTTKESKDKKTIQDVTPTNNFLAGADMTSLDKSGSRGAVGGLPLSGGGNIGSGSGKSIIMNLDIKNIFQFANVDEARNKSGDLANEIIGHLNDRLRDAALTL